MQTIQITEKQLHQPLEYLGRFNQYSADCAKYFYSWYDCYLLGNIAIFAYWDENGYAYRSEWNDFIPVSYYLVSQGKINAWKRMQREEIDRETDFKELEKVNLEFEGERAVDWFACSCRQIGRETQLSSLIDVFVEHKAELIFQQIQENLLKEEYHFATSAEIENLTWEKLPDAFIKVSNNKDPKKENLTRYDIVTRKYPDVGFLLIEKKEEVNTSTGFYVDYTFVSRPHILESILQEYNLEYGEEDAYKEGVIVGKSEETLNLEAQFDGFYINGNVGTIHKDFSNIHRDVKEEYREFSLPFRLRYSTQYYHTDDYRFLPFMDTFERTGSGKQVYGNFFWNRIYLTSSLEEEILPRKTFVGTDKEYVRELVKILNDIPKENIFSIINENEEA